MSDEPTRPPATQSDPVERDVSIADASIELLEMSPEELAVVAQARAKKPTSHDLEVTDAGGELAATMALPMDNFQDSSDSNTWRDITEQSEDERLPSAGEPATDASMISPEPPTPLESQHPVAIEERPPIGGGSDVREALLGNAQAPDTAPDGHDSNATAVGELLDPTTGNQDAPGFVTIKPELVPDPATASPLPDPRELGLLSEDTWIAPAAPPAKDERDDSVALDERVHRALGSEIAQRLPSDALAPVEDPAVKQARQMPTVQFDLPEEAPPPSRWLYVALVAMCVAIGVLISLILQNSG